VRSDVVPLQQAMSIPGLRAVFGEAYPDPVRVVSMQPQVRLSVCCNVLCPAGVLVVRNSTCDIYSGATDSDDFQPNRMYGTPGFSN
jgi:hypothetical protein